MVKSASRPGLTGAGSSSFRSIRAERAALTRHLRSRHTLWLHGWLMGVVTLAVTWAGSALLRHAGVEALALRYALALGVGYLAYLLLLRLWAGLLVREEERDVPDPGDLLDLPWPDGGHGGIGGGGGDFGGGGADALFDAPVQALTEGAGDAAGSVLGDVASGALDAAGAADEGAIVVIPVLAVFAAVLAAALGAGALLLLYFGSETLLVAAVELAFAYTAARTAVRMEREGWLLAAIRLSWKPLLGALISAVVLGALIDHFVPQADTLAEALRALRHH